MAATHAQCARGSARPRVVVIGAGFSGLGAALKLVSESLFNVTLLEGSSRVGGRARAINVSDQVLEMGCQYFYLHEGSPGNALPEYALSKRLDSTPPSMVHRRLQDRGIGHRRKLELLSNGDEMPRDKVKYYKHLIHKILCELGVRSQTNNWSYVIDSSWGEDPCDPHGISLMDYLTQRFSSVTASDVQSEVQSESWRPAQVLRHMLAFESHYNGSNTSNVDVPSYGEYIDEVGYIPLPRGFQSVAESLAAELPPGSIHYNKDVQTVKWSPVARDTHSASPVTVVCTDGTTYDAEHVIVTVSLGVLKQRCLSPSASPQLFQPALPEPKLECIRKLGMGFVNKVFLEFKEPLVDETIGRLVFYWREEDLGYPEKYPWAREIWSVDRVVGSTLYIVWFCGEGAQAVEGLPDAEVAEGICLVLERFLRRFIERPIHVITTKWCTDKFFLGSYSYNAIGTGAKDREKLAEPLSGLTPLQVLFAGSATHPTLYGTTNAAYESGLREADRLIKLYNRSDNMK